MRRIVYTTNAIEALNSKLCRAVRTRGRFRGDAAAMKLLYLVLNNAASAAGANADRRSRRDTFLSRRLQEFRHQEPRQGTVR